MNVYTVWSIYCKTFTVEASNSNEAKRRACYKISTFTNKTPTDLWHEKGAISVKRGDYIKEGEMDNRIVSESNLTEADLCLLRDAMSKETLLEALEETEKALQNICPKLGYCKAVPFTMRG